VTWKPRLITADELPAVIDLTSLVFGAGQRAPKSYAEVYRKVVEVDRTFVVDDGAVLAGTAASYSLDMALPGGGAVPMAAVTEVVVLPTHRRQGALTVLMGALLDQAVERGEPLAGLTASEATIYRRYGYGVAARFQSVEVQRARAAPLVPVEVPGRIRFLTEDEASTVLPQVWERGWRRRPGELSRKPSWWEVLALDPDDDRDGASARYLVAHEDESGAPDGFAVYRFKDTDAGPGFELQIHDLSAVDDGVEAALLRYLLDIDLVDHVLWFAAPLDLPLPWQLEDSRAIAVKRVRDHLWLRVLDVGACLGERTYASDGGAVIEVVDGRRPEVGGVFRLDGGRDGAACARTGAAADVVVDVATLGSLLLGDVTWANLRRSGLVDERTGGTVDRLDALFRPERAPYCSTDF
jgi:predicted acetyltransferase